MDSHVMSLINEKDRKERFCISAVVRLLRMEPKDNGGWSFPFDYISTIKKKAEIFEPGISLEEVDAVLRAISEQ